MKNRSRNRSQNRNGRFGVVRKPAPVNPMVDMAGRLSRLAERAESTLDGSVAQPLISILTGAILFIENINQEEEYDDEDDDEDEDDTPRQSSPRPLRNLREEWAGNLPQVPKNPPLSADIAEELKRSMRQSQRDQEELQEDQEAMPEEPRPRRPKSNGRDRSRRSVSAVGQMKDSHGISGGDINDYDITWDIPLNALCGDCRDPVYTHAVDHNLPEKNGHIARILCDKTRAYVPKGQPE